MTWPSTARQSMNNSNHDLAFNSQAVYEQQSTHVITRIWTRKPSVCSALGPNDSEEHRVRTMRSGYSVKNGIHDSKGNVSGTMHRQRVITVTNTSCAATTFPEIQYDITLHDPVLLEFNMLKDSEFVLNNCHVLLRAPNGTRISIVLLAMSCSRSVNGRVQMIVALVALIRQLHFAGTFNSWESCVRHINPGVDWLSEGNTASFQLAIGGDGLFTARMNAMAVMKPEPGTIFTRYLTPTLGYIQNVGLALNHRAVSWENPVKTNAWSHLAVPEHSVVMISVAIAGLGTLPSAQACQHRVELYEGSMNKTVWRLCSRYRSLPQPHISYEGHVHVHFVSDQDDDKLIQGIGFRLIYTLHDKSSIIPVYLTDGKWNCSAPTWLSFHQHFICDLVIQCAGGEDETDCPVYTHCGHNGVLWNGNCYSLNRLDPGTTWHQANAVCSSLGPGGRLASYSEKLFEFVPRKLRHDLIIASGNIMIYGMNQANVDIHFYGHLFQTVDNKVDYVVQSSHRFTFFKFVVYFHCDRPARCQGRSWYVVQAKCVKYVCYAFCETNVHLRNVTTRARDKPDSQLVVVPDTSVESGIVPFPHVTCDHGHVAHAFLAFDQQPPGPCLTQAASDLTFCKAVRGWESSACYANVTSFPVSFACRSETQHVHYTLVCDHRQDCQDDSDEDFCSFPPCDPTVHFQCDTKRECQPINLKCNYQPDCLDASDEHDCRSVNIGPAFKPTPPFIVDLEGSHGWPIITDVKNTTHPYCPHTHYLCPSDGNCMPVFTRCNGVADCSEKEDEGDCESYVCPGLYRCRGRGLCVLPSDLCDGVLHCPQHDDERFCHLPCPDHCTCLGYAFVCRRPFESQLVPQLRYLDARGSGIKPEELTQNVMLIYLNLAQCDVIYLKNVTLPNLNTLDLSDNKITIISLLDLFDLKCLHDVKLSGNPLTSLFAAPQSVENLQISALQTLDLSRVKIETLRLTALVPFSSLQVLNLSQSGVKIVQKTNEHTSLPRTLRALDVSGCDVTEFPRTLFQGVDNLKVVYADTYKVCCPAMLPDAFNVDDCHAPVDEISSCDDLLRSIFYRGCLFALAASGLLGNSVSFIVRFCANKRNSRSGFGVFVQHLCLSDFLMGVYLVFIGVADRLFLGNYLWEDTSWRHSATCRLAGFISLMSCEVSSFIICLITVDRFLVLRFPFSQLHFRSISAQIASTAAWVAGCTLAAVPLLPAAQSWQFYSQTGICIPLPVTRQEFAGHGYAFGVMIVLNFLLFIMIAGGQVFIYASIQASKMSDGETSSKSHDAAIARRLITVAVSDFLCWFPVGLLGLLASSGTPVPGTVNVAMAIFVLPLNSALNPFLYTFNMLQERFQKSREDKLLKMLTQKV